jgi:aerobic carbon-monoxide dehydrogenase small subunit
MIDANAPFPRKIDISLTVNGERVEARVDASRHLVDFLRLDLGLTGSHAGCEHGVCGACTLQVNGDIVRGCLTLAAQLDGADVWTVEGLTDTGALADLQAEFVTRNALQCGFCTPGMLFSAADLLAGHAHPTRDEIREHISGNYCRCTGYEAIVDAIETVATARAAKAGVPA